MTDENKKFLERINAYANNVLGEIDPQKVQISLQLEKLRPIMEEIAEERGMLLEDVFILYMDLQTVASVKSEEKLREELQELNEGDGMPILFR